MSARDLLAQPHLSVITRSADVELERIVTLLDHKVLISGRGDLEMLFGELLAAEAPPSPKTLDLIGHSTPGKSLLMIGDFVIDAAKPTVTAFFRELAEQNVLPRLGIYAMRLLGCLTADTGHARWTMCTLADILGVEVYGTKDLIFSAHYDGQGFLAERRYLLVSASELRTDGVDPKPLARGMPYERVLDLDALPAMPLVAGDHPWPLRIASIEEASSFLRLVRRRDGATMPGLLTSPRCEVALPSPQTGKYHRAQLLLDGEFIRVYPDGPSAPGIVYPVDDPYALKNLVDRMPVAIVRIATAADATGHSVV